MKKIGVWLAGIRGTVATTAIVGAHAMAQRLTGRWGLVTELPEVAALPLASFDRFVFGGWEVISASMTERARALAREDHVLPVELVDSVESDLEIVERQVRPGFLNGSTPGIRMLGLLMPFPAKESLSMAVERLKGDLERFRREHNLETVIVVNLASTEVAVTPGREHDDLDAFRRILKDDRHSLITPCSLYAYAALDSGFPYVDFTPSIALKLGALRELAQERGVPFYGSDGKTGETLLKAALAPVFRSRNLEVLSWEGFNILGGGDGQVLKEPEHKTSKLRSKAGVLPAALGYTPHSGVFIEYVPSLGNWKTAWDFIHFRGFMGTRMSAQFTWQGCDAILAAPLVLDLVRLVEFAQRSGEIGAMTHLACFFKDPLGVTVHSYPEQFRLLLDYVERHGATKEQAPAASAL